MEDGSQRGRLPGPLTQPATATEEAPRPARALSRPERRLRALQPPEGSEGCSGNSKRLFSSFSRSVFPPLGASALRFLGDSDAAAGRSGPHQRLWPPHWEQGQPGETLPPDRRPSFAQPRWELAPFASSDSGEGRCNAGVPELGMPGGDGQGRGVRGEVQERPH